MSEPLTMEQKTKEYEKMFEKNCHFAHVSSPEDAISFLKGYGKAVGDAYADKLESSHSSLILKCIALVIGLIMTLTSEDTVVFSAVVAAVLAPSMARNINDIKACQQGVKDTGSYKDLSVIKGMPDSEIVQFTNNLIDDCNSKIELPTQNQEEKKKRRRVQNKTESTADPSSDQNDKENSGIDDNMEVQPSFHGESMDDTHERINWKKKPLLVAAGIVLALLIGFCVYCAVAEIERPMEPVNLEDTRRIVVHDISYSVPYCFLDPVSNRGTLSLYAERGKRMVHLFFGAMKIPENEVSGDVNDMMDSALHGFFENSSNAGNQSEEMECIQNAESTTLAGMPAKTYYYTDRIEGQDMNVTLTISCDSEEDTMVIVALTQSTAAKRDYSEAYDRIIASAVAAEQTEDEKYQVEIKRP